MLAETKSSKPKYAKNIDFILLLQLLLSGDTAVSYPAHLCCGLAGWDAGCSCLGEGPKGALHKAYIFNLMYCSCLCLNDAASRQ